MSLQGQSSHVREEKSTRAVPLTRWRLTWVYLEDSEAELELFAAERALIGRKIHVGQNRH